MMRERRDAHAGPGGTNRRDAAGGPACPLPTRGGMRAPARHLAGRRHAFALSALRCPALHRQPRRRSRGATAVKHAAWLPIALVACAHGSPKKAMAPPALEVQDAVHGVRYSLPSGADTWQVSREGNARSVSGVETEVSSFALAKPSTPQQCREHARSRLSAKKEPPAANAASADAPRDQSTSDSPAATWSFTSGATSAPVRNRWAFFARNADCLVLNVTGPKDDSFAEQTFDTAARSFQVLLLPPDRQREVDLLAGMGFLERRDPGAALERFEALTVREPENAKAHFGALMAGFELGQD